MISRSQSFQDKFAYSILGENSTYLEIGARWPIKMSNTYELEVSHNWKGISLELDVQVKPFWDSTPERKNKIYWNDALTFDYRDAILNNNLPLRLGYLSCDIEPPYNTFSALKRVIEQGITFDCITFEHDLYSYKEKNFCELATEYLILHGYKVAVRNVTHVDKKGIENHYETWYVNNDIPFEEIDFKNWIKL